MNTYTILHRKKDHLKVLKHMIHTNYNDPFYGT